MLHAVLLGLLAAPPSKADVDAWAKSYSHGVGEPPTELSVKGVGFERTIAEFMDVCVRPGLKIEDVNTAVQSSDFAYVQQHANDSPNSYSWSSKRGYLVVNIDGMFSQCALSIGSNEPRTGEQLLSVLRPAVEAEVGHPVQEDKGKFYLQWTDAESGYVERITLGGASAEAKQAIWYIFDKTAPGVREKLDSINMSPSE